MMFFEGEKFEKMLYSDKDILQETILKNGLIPMIRGEARGGIPNSAKDLIT
jgi:hypothetical protein